MDCVASAVCRHRRFVTRIVSPTSKFETTSVPHVSTKIHGFSGKSEIAAATNQKIISSDSDSLFTRPLLGLGQQK
jgi:hypothetical protein